QRGRSPRGAPGRGPGAAAPDSRDDPGRARGPGPFGGPRNPSRCPPGPGSAGSGGAPGQPARDRGRRRRGGRLVSGSPGFADDRGGSPALAAAAGGARSPARQPGPAGGGGGSPVRRREPGGAGPDLRKGRQF